MNVVAVNHEVVSREKWIEARKELLAKEKDLRRQMDEISQQRRQLPWTKVEKTYLFDGPRGQETLKGLFAGRNQLIIYHFMLGPGWQEGCKSCSFLADHIDGSLAHLAHRDLTLAVVSRAPFQEIQAFKQRMGWRFPWVSSFNTDFNFDYGVSFTKPETANEKVSYNYSMGEYQIDELPGLSAFYLDASGDVFHTYSTYARGLDVLVGTYNYLDLAPKGRDEDGLPFTMSWVRHHDRYEDAIALSNSASCCHADQAL